MTLMIAGLIVFFAVHLLPSFPDRRQRLIHQWGVLGYKGVFSVASLVGLIMVVVGKGQADFVPVWTPPGEFLALNKLLMLPAMVLLVAAYIPRNGIRAKVRHPMLAGVKLWAVGHLLANGDLASMILFGSFLVFAVFDMVSINRRTGTAGPVVADVSMTVLTLLVGGALYALVGWFHGPLFGVEIR